MNTILVTGAAGFIGFHTCLMLLKKGEKIIGFDNLNNYYSVKLKKERLEILDGLNIENKNNWIFIEGNLEDRGLIENIFCEYSPNIVINLAAQAGVRYSQENPLAYINSNIIGFVNLLESCKKRKINNFIYASSSSVYGGNVKLPFSEDDPVNHPVSLYAATKRSNELLAHTYSHIYGLPCIGLRFFTVYGPWGRPDMAPMIFANSILKKEPINIFNNGNMKRDFTYINDVVEIIRRLIKKPPNKYGKFNFENPNPSESWSPYLIFNVGNSEPINLLDFIKVLEEEIGEKAIKSLKPMLAGDVKQTFSDSKKIKDYIQFIPNTPLKRGIKEFVKWYKNYYEL